MVTANDLEGQMFLASLDTKSFSGTRPLHQSLLTDGEVAVSKDMCF